MLYTYTYIDNLRRRIISYYNHTISTGTIVENILLKSFFLALLKEQRLEHTGFGRMCYWLCSLIMFIICMDFYANPLFTTLLGFFIFTTEKYLLWSLVLSDTLVSERRAHCISHSPDYHTAALPSCNLVVSFRQLVFIEPLFKHSLPHPCVLLPTHIGNVVGGVLASSTRVCIFAR